MMLDSGIERRAPPKKAGVVSRVVTVAGQLVLPVLALGGAIALAWMWRGYVATDFRFLVKIDPSLDLSDGWLTWGVLLLPCVFFALNLTSRRYGPAIAFAAVALAWIFLAGAAALAIREELIRSSDEIAATRTIAAFVGAMFLGQIVNIYLFDWFRGIPWWKAPFVAALCGGLVFTAVFHTVMGGNWNAEALPRLAVLGAVQLIWALSQLAPTQLLRRAIRPGAGYGGA
jgi:uncharacterized PurR-regulated membrane protein YhhQ (DUF165 family)